MMPKLEVRRLRRIAWSMVSKAAWSMVSKAALRSRERKGGKTIVNCMIDRIKEVNERGFSGVMFAIG